MAYIGSTPTSQNFISGTDYFSGTGSQTAFILTRTVNSVNDIEVVINNVVQQPSTAYTISGTTITFTSAPSSGTNNIYVRYLSTNMQSFTVPANSITRNQLDSNLQSVAIGKNRIINGAMMISQRQSASSFTPASGDYLLDRWNWQASQASKFTVQQNAGSVTPPVGFSNYMGFTVASSVSIGSGDYFYFRQPVEGFNFADCGWGTANAKTVTLSFKVYSSLTGTFGGAINNSAQNRSYPFSYTVSSANTWTDVSVTIAGDTSGTWVGATNGVGVYVNFSLGMGSTYSGTAGAWAGALYASATGATSVVGTNGATFYITGVQLEVGSSATGYEYRLYNQELIACQRYYQKYTQPSLKGVMGNASTMNRAGMILPVVMRTAPTSTMGAVSLFDGTSIGTFSSFAADYSTNTTLEYDLLSTTSWAITGRPGIVYQNGSASLQLSAEL